MSLLYGKLTQLEEEMSMSSYRYSHEACFLLSKSLKTDARNLILAFLKYRQSLLVSCNTNIIPGQHRDTAQVLRHKILGWQYLAFQVSGSDYTPFADTVVLLIFTFQVLTK